MVCCSRRLVHSSPETAATREGEPVPFWSVIANRALVTKAQCQFACSVQTAGNRQVGQKRRVVFAERLVHAKEVHLALHSPLKPAIDRRPIESIDARPERPPSYPVRDRRRESGSSGIRHKTRAQNTSSRKSRVSSKLCVCAILESQAVHGNMYFGSAEIACNQV